MAATSHEHTDHGEARTADESRTGHSERVRAEEGQAQQAALGKDVGRLFDGGGVGCGK